MVVLDVAKLGSGFSFGPKTRAQPGNVFTESTVTASDSTNAAKLGPLGYVAFPTSAWTTGQKITVSGFAFNWTGVAWAAGAHALRAGETSAEDDSADTADTDDYPEGGTIPEVKEWVGDDPDRAQDALDRENEGGSPRVTLVEHLQSLL